MNTPNPTQSTIIIATDEGTKMILPATAAALTDTFFARQLWVFLVENLQPGFTVILEAGIPDGPIRFERQSGDKIPIDSYRVLMEEA